MIQTEVATVGRESPTFDWGRRVAGVEADLHAISSIDHARDWYDERVAVASHAHHLFGPPLDGD